MNDKKRQNHLEYYKQHGIAPVRYDMSSMDAHLDRRESLYNMLGLLPLTFREAKVLEVAAGTGHNSLYIATQMPKNLVLLEPNPTALEHIQAVYSSFDRAHTPPVVITKTLEDYIADEPFDIILCENWLGVSKHETGLMRKLADFVATNGLLVITVVSPIGFVPNLLRRFFVPYLAPADLEFDVRTKILEDAFYSHLITLPSMTRNATDWVHDNMLNPAYFELCLSIPMVISQLGEDFEVARSYPSFEEDWRWFKGLYGEFRLRNEHFLEEYWLKCHNYLDSKAKTFPSDSIRNQSLEENALKILKAVEDHEDAHLHGGDIAGAVSAVYASYERYLAAIPNELSGACLALEEIGTFIKNPAPISPTLMAEMELFRSLFGRETSYISLKRR